MEVLDFIRVCKINFSIFIIVMLSALFGALRWAWTMRRDLKAAREEINEMSPKVPLLVVIDIEDLSIANEHNEKIKCRVCEEKSIRLDDNYCSICGSRIEWDII